MKVSYVFIAAAQASPKSTQQWLVDNWWTIAVETFNFASSNWEQFAAAVDGVSQNQDFYDYFRPMGQLGDFKGHYLVNDKMIQVDQSMFPPLFDWCNSNGDSEISSEELVNCSKKGAEYFDMPDDYQNYIYKFGQKYWHLVDQDNSGSLNYDEYKYTMAGFAAVDAGLIIKVRKLFLNWRRKDSYAQLNIWFQFLTSGFR